MIGGKDGKYCAVDSDIIKCNYVPTPSTVWKSLN